MAQVQHAAAFFQAGAFAALKGDGAWEWLLGKWCDFSGPIWKKIETPSLTNVILRIVKGDPMFINKKVLLSLYELIGFSVTNE